MLTHSAAHSVDLTPITSHVWQWMRDSRDFKAEALIAQAFNAASQTTAELPAESDLREAACRELADLLSVALTKQLDSWVRKNCGYVNHTRAPLLTSATRRPLLRYCPAELFVPLACSLWSEVDFQALAEVALREKELR